MAKFETKVTIPRFSRRFLEGLDRFTRIGDGAIGGKAQGLAVMQDLLADHVERERFPGISVHIPRLVVLTTDVFTAFMAQNNLYDIACSDLPDDRIAHAFVNADLPATMLGDLLSIANSVRIPLAIRSSSLLEDAMYEPFAGVYGTKMIPNNLPSADARFRKLTEAVKFVYASTFFKSAKNYIAMTDKDIRDEKMAVIIQEVVGERRGNRFYPTLAGVARSHNFYPIGHARAEDGVVDLALGLGRTIVDGGRCWSYSPAFPRALPPFNSTADILKSTQTTFWAVNMGPAPVYDPLRETEYLVQGDLGEAEYDDTLRHISSTYLASSDRLVMGTGPEGPRAITFAPLLQQRAIPLNDLVRYLLEMCEARLGSEVEIEFAVNLDRRNAVPASLGFLQVRPMVVSHDVVDLQPEEMTGEKVLAASTRVLGNGALSSIEDVVFVRPAGFEARNTPRIAQEIEAINRRLTADGKPYLLIGFGRWGSSDPWLGTPVAWDQISGARVIIEATLPDMNVEMSQGSHFFHNITSFQVFYFSIHHAGEHVIDWDWLERQETASASDLVKHVRLAVPLSIKVDGRNGRGVVLHG
ncbi:hypothetical protein JW905_03350 [bacterium]|nr:hypothetical protein [candidate division CSSED10-310 bacterium]